MMARFIQLLTVFGTIVTAAPSPASLKSDVNILIDNDLQGTNSPSADSGIILLGARSLEAGAAACEALGEQLWSPELNTASIQPNLDFLNLQQKEQTESSFWIAPQGRNARSIHLDGKVSSATARNKLPVLCTQTAPFSYRDGQDTDEKWQIQVGSNNETYVGFRDRLTFRFLGLRYAPEPTRFGYSELYEGSGDTFDATQYGSQCIQHGNGLEDCLFLNIWTSLLPKPGCSKASLKPVMFWMHGGGFTDGTSNDPDMDGGNIASRGDVVVVSINYRLGNLGFLALDDGVTNGNFGFADQINALDWVRKNIKNFGGDPDNITIFGQSAGAGSVRAMMDSPKAIGKFAKAIPLSNLGGVNYGATFSKYYTIEEEMEVTGNAILEETNCTDATSKVDCLREVDAITLSTLSWEATARYMVVDGTYITHDELQFDNGKAPYELMMGTTRDDGAAIISYPNTVDKEDYLASTNFDIPPEDLFPIPQSTNETYALYNMTSRLATDSAFRCIDQATVKAGLDQGKFSPVYYYEFDRTYQLMGWPKSSVCEPPKTDEHPNGDPSLEYFKCHSGELYYVFGNLAREQLPMRDEFDLPFEQFVLDSFTSFARTGNPNPDAGYLEARGFVSTLKEVQDAGEWEPSTEGDLTMRVLDWPSYQGDFRELAQCEGLGLGLDYYQSE